MMEIGRLCLKIAGRDAGKTCVIIDLLEEGFVLIDGQTRRRKCNVKHLEPLNKVIKTEKNASTKVVADAFKKLGLEVRETKPKKAVEKPKKVKALKTKNSKSKKTTVKNKTEKVKEPEVKEATKVEVESKEE